MTHKQVKNTNRRWKRNYGADGEFVPKLVKARSLADGGRIGIHLLNPTKDELASSFCSAQRDLFPEIVIHTKRTFGIYKRSA